LNSSKSFLKCDDWCLPSWSNPLSVLSGDFKETHEFTIHEHLQEIAIHWKYEDSLRNMNSWLTYDFQQNVMPIFSKNIKVVYGSFSLNNNTKGFFPLYLFDFRLTDSLQIKNPLKKSFGKLVEARILLVGQWIATGPNVPFTDYLLDKHFQKAFHLFIQKVAVRNRAKAILWKDFFSKSAVLEENGYFPFHYQPAMILSLRDDWHTMEDYEGALTSKYRVRLNRARKKMKDVVWHILCEKDIEKWQSDLHRLYQGVVSEAVFNLINLPESYFIKMKKAFGINFNIKAGFCDGRLVCFYATLLNGKTLEANIAGFDEEFNLNLQLYLNMLYLMIEDGIHAGCAEINFYRTAMEIKSSVGATGYDSVIYLKPTSKWLSPFFPLLIPWFSPKNPVWKPRSPFKSLRV
jgi:hypothetical protein